MIPVSTKTLWVNKFIAWSFYWVLFTLVQSVIVGYIYFLKEDFQAEEEEIRKSSAVPVENGVAGVIDSDSAKGPDNNSVGSNNGSTKGSQSNNAEEKPLMDGTFHKKPFYHICSTRKFDCKSPQFRFVSMRLQLCSYSQGYSGLTLILFQLFPAISIADICMALCFLSYTIFIIAMFTSVRGKGWAQQESEWDDSNFFWIEYDNKAWDPFLQ